MSIFSDLMDKVNEIPANLDDIRADIQRIKDQLASGVLTAEEATTLKTALDEKVAAIKALADENA